MVKGRQKTTSLSGRNASLPDRCSDSGGFPSATDTTRTGGKERSALLVTVTEADRLQIDEAGERWLHLTWSISRKTADRAHSAMGREAHRYRQVLRVHSVDPGESGPPSKSLLTQIDIPGDCAEWYLRIPTSCETCQVELGVIFGQSRFFSLLHSSSITMAPQQATRPATMFLGASAMEGETDSGDPPPLAVQGTFVLQGETRPKARLLIDDRETPVDPQSGRFEWQLPLSNGRVVVPVHVSQGGQIRRALLAVETNFHLLAPESANDE